MFWNCLYKVCPRLPGSALLGGWVPTHYQVKLQLMLRLSWAVTTRRNSCHQYKIKQEETKSSKRPLSWRGIVAADDAGLQKAAPNSNASGDTKSKKKKDGT